MSARIFILIVLIFIILIATSSYFLFFYEKDVCANYKERDLESRDWCYYNTVRFGYESYKQAGMYNKINFALCEKIENITLKDFCYDYMASLKSDKDGKLSFCGKIFDKSMRENCYSSKCHDFNDVECCDNIDDIIEKTGCIKIIAVTLKNLEICKKIPIGMEIRYFCCYDIGCRDLDEDSRWECGDICRKFGYSAE